MKEKGDTPGSRLRKLRQYLGKSQNTLAREFGISASTLSRYETDVREPDIDFFILLKSKTGIDLNWLSLSSFIFPGESSFFKNRDRISRKGIPSSQAYSCAT